MNSPMVVAVTGSSSGIGRAVALAFAEKQAALIIHGCRNVAGLQEVGKESRAKSLLEPLAIFADISEPSAVKRLVQAAFARYSYVDAWIHCAGADVLTGSAKTLSFGEKLERLWKTDVAGTIQLSRAVAQRMREQTARPQLPTMIHVGWDQASQGIEGDSGQYFCCVKSAVAAFSKSLAKSVAPHIRVNCVAPGWIKTEWGQMAADGWSERAKGESLLKRWGTANDIAKAVVWLCSQEAEFINGQTIAVNGGWTSMHFSARSETTFGF